MSPIAPVAPPVAQPQGVQAPVPVAPPDANIAPAADPSFASPVRAPETNLHSMYEDAASRGDPVSMYSLTSRLKGTPMEAPVKKVAEQMQERLTKFENEVKPIVQAGGINTPQGNIAASKVFETVADKPERMKAFVEYLLGNPKWRTFVTGGTPTTTIAYDKQGNQLEKTVNELGQIISVVDSATGRKLNREELGERGGLVPSLDAAIGYQQEKEQNKFNTEALNKSNAAVGEYASNAPEQKKLYEEMGQRLQNLHGVGLTEEQRKAIGSFTTRSMGYAQTLSDGLSALDQKIDNKNVSLDSKQQKALNAVLEAAGLKVGADGSITNSKGQNVSKSDMEQIQKSLTNGSQFERNFTQSKEDFIRSEVFKNLGEAEMKNLGRILDLQQQLERNQLELVSKHGTLPFLINPKSYQLGDEFSRGQASALIGEFNADATEAFAAWRQRQLERYPKGQAPKPGELEQAFTRTDQFQDLRRNFAERNRQILNRPGESAPKREETAADWNLNLGINPEKKPTEGVKARSISNKPAESSVPKEYTLIGKTPDGKNVYRTPDGKKVVEQ